MADVNPPTETAQAIAASALRAQQQRMRLIAENLANSDSTSKTPGGDPYQRQTPIFETKLLEAGAKGVQMSRVGKDKTPFREEYQPGNPAADTKGYVKMPNVDPLIESLDMREAQRAYEANLSVIETSRALQSSTIDLLKK